ncbi:serine/threonine-protein kinase [Chlorogloeopsis sp. ULAP01]|uniref:serine/threonine protein kinase n=1 Tax=Chlorogloeopsis sp. ULAP01 TaxID=3056483 RepID=UPI0025AB362A|nr:serine/threonine-protein kinase [Chlorogloeopsis sp. ULAP01]MDM9382625.1 serine/threonine-protein kinase [Chlorogloeopsis sp. ULAP01]
MLFGTILRNRYKVLTKLGTGGFSDTYLAEDMDLPSYPKCVVKHLVTRNSNPEILQIAKRLFNQEAEVLYRLGKHHDQIPELLAHFEENGEFYLVQEYVDGHDLTTEITTGRQLSETEVIKLLQEILEVLAVVHEHNVIHRDLKLQNIMRRQDGRIVLIDFGSVKQIKSLATSIYGEVTSTIVIGTPGYIPNEQANGNPRLCSDIYAVGIIAIQALTGVVPRKMPIDPTTGEVIWRPLVHVSDQLANVLTRMVRYNFSQRYQTATQVLEALQWALPPTTIGRTPPPRQKVSYEPSSDLPNSQIIPILGLLSVMVVGLGVAIFGGRFFQFSFRGNKPTQTTSPTVKDVKIKPITPSSTPASYRRKPNFNSVPSTPLFQEPLNQTPIESFTPEIEYKTKPSPSTPAIKTKPSTPAIEENTNKPSTPLSEDNTQPSTPAIEDNIKPCTPAIEDNTNSSCSSESESENTNKPSAPVFEDSVKPCTPAIEDNSNSSCSSESENEDNTKLSTPAVEDNRQMMMVSPTPVTEEKNNQLMVPSTPVIEEQSKQFIVPSKPIIEKDNQLIVPSTPVKE